jgi:hypothetical protein
MGKILVLTGLLVAGIGLLIMLGVPLGRLPGDVVYRRGSATFYLPMATSVLLSILVILLVSFMRR